MYGTAILWPTLALVALVYAVWFWMYVTRIGHMQAHPPGPDDLSTLGFMRYSQPVEMPANNLRNLFEMPVLYFALVPLLLLFHAVTSVQLVLAWGYVALRAIHSVIHGRKGPVIARFGVYLMSCAVLLAMWVGLIFDVLILR
ncbi:MAG TPA: MAPEG family protein [Sphingobium sp.]|nr:MAPEG family protein [Sphingobium sp.]